MSEEELKHEDSWDELPASLKQIESDLAALRPRDDRLDRGQLAFLAGRASMAREAGRRARRWTAACAGMTTVAAALFVMLIADLEPDAPRTPGDHMAKQGGATWMRPLNGTSIRLPTSNWTPYRK